MASTEQNTVSEVITRRTELLKEAALAMGLLLDDLKLRAKLEGTPKVLPVSGGRLLRFQSALKAIDCELAKKYQIPEEIDWPDYHYEGMGCGLEDRGITDRYEAAQYGWDEAMSRMTEALINAGVIHG